MFGLFWKEHLIAGLKEDGFPWDWTTLSIGRRSAESNHAKSPARAKIIAKSPGIWAGNTLGKALEQVSAEITGSNLSFKYEHLKADGDWVRANDIVCKWLGPPALLLAFERTYLNLACYVSGIATKTRYFVDLLHRRFGGHLKKNQFQPLFPKVAMTRKTLPGFRDLSTYGVILGGGASHRWNLASGILLKENHLFLAGGLNKAIQNCRHNGPHPLRVEVEVKDITELKQAVKSHIDIILLDNFTPAQIQEAIHWLKQQAHSPLVEVSGGIHEANFEDYLFDGIHIYSLGCLTHSVKALDLSMKLV